MRGSEPAAKIERFEDLIAWRKARELTRMVYQVTKTGSFARDAGLANRTQRAAGSIMANIAEGFERGSRAEFHQFLSTAKGSCDETRSLLYVALDANYADQSNVDLLFARTEEVGRIVGRLRAAVERQRNEQRATRHQR